jgi:hypothetical protein
MPTLQSWYSVNDGLPCGCIIPDPVVPTLRRRFSPDCRMVDVGPATPQAYFSIAPSVQSNGHQASFSYDRAYMNVYRKGREDLLITTYNVWRRDINGAIGWYFDDTLFNQPPGFFIGDVFIDCDYCFSVQLRLPRCESVVTSCYVQPIMEQCGEGECSVIQPMGEGLIGGGECALPPAVTTCGTQAPYFPLENPLKPPAPCAESSACCLTPDPAGFQPAGPA